MDFCAKLGILRIYCMVFRNCNEKEFLSFELVWYSIRCFGCNLLKVQAYNFPRSPANCTGTQFVFFGKETLLLIKVAMIILQLLSRGI